MARYGRIRGNPHLIGEYVKVGGRLGSGGKLETEPTPIGQDSVGERLFLRRG